MLSFVFGELERFLLLLRLRLMPSESVIILSYTAAGEHGGSMGELEREKEKRKREEGGRRRCKRERCLLCGRGREATQQREGKAVEVRVKGAAAGAGGTR